ncbi:MAG: hypothetical protein KDK53_00890 [Maritimibacter sp.]|nr:hypothetical protein [Maritimibacter sp.]
MRLAFAIFLAVTVCAVTVCAVTGAARAQEAGSAGIDCYCTDRSGSRVELGQTICLIVDGRAFLARCEMSLNVPAWRDIGEACVGAGLMSTPDVGFRAPGVSETGGA